MARFRGTTSKKEGKEDGAAKQTRTSRRTNKDDQEAADLVNAAIGHVVPPSGSPDDNIVVNMDDNDRPARKRGRPASTSTSTVSSKRQKTAPSTATVDSSAPGDSAAVASTNPAKQTPGRLPRPSKQLAKEATRSARTTRSTSSPPRSSVPVPPTRQRRAKASAVATPAPEPVDAPAATTEDQTTDKDYEVEDDSDNEPEEDASTQVDGTKTFSQLSDTALNIAEELINDLGRPRTKPCQRLREAIEKLRVYLDKQPIPVESLDDTATGLLEHIVDQVEKWKALDKGTSNTAKQYYCDIIGFAMTHITRLLSTMLKAFGSSDLTIQQMEQLLRVMSCASQLYKHAEALTTLHKFDGTETCNEVFDPVKIKLKVIGIYSRIKTVNQVLIRRLQESRQAEVTARDHQRKAAEMKDRARHAEAKATFDARLAAQEATWKRLHLVRQYGEFPFKPPTFTERVKSIDPSRLKLLTHTDLLAARAEAALHAAAHKAWFSSSDASVAIPWHGRAWTLTEDGYLTAALTAFGTADKPWDHVVQTTCEAKLTPRFEPGRLGRFTLADIVSRGVYLARRAMRADYQAARARRAWTCVVDPRLDRDEGLQRMRWPPVVEAQPEQRPFARFARPSQEGQAAPVRRPFKSLRRPDSFVTAQGDSTTQQSIVRPALAEVIAVSDSEPDDGLADLSESEPEPSPMLGRL